MKLFYIPNYSKYYITKSGKIYDECANLIYDNNFILPKLFADDGNYSILTLVDIASAYYGYLPNTEIGIKCSDDRISSKNIYYIIKKIQTFNDTILYINGNVFKQIPGFEKYYISEYGVIYSTFSSNFIRYNISKKYLITVLVNNTGEKQYKYIHHLVYETYNGARHKKYVIDHIDEKKWNNHKDNLQEITYGQNTQKASEAIRRSYQSDIFTITNKKWSYLLIDHLCREMERGKSASDICDSLNLTKERDRNAIIGKLFELRNNPYINKKYDFSKYNPTELKIKSLNKYSKEVYKSILFLNSIGYSNTEIAKILEIPRQSIYNIIKRNSDRKVQRLSKAR